MIDFNKKIKEDRVKLFVYNVTKMANNTPAQGYTIGDAMKQLPGNLQQFVISEIPDKVLRAEYARRDLGHLEDCALYGEDEIKETYRNEIYRNNELHTIADLLGVDCIRPDLLEVVEAVLKLFPERWTLRDLQDILYDAELDGIL